jgi:Tol biopolymer transport system component
MIAFASDRAGASTVFVVSTTGSGGERAVYRHPAGGAFPGDWSRDGKYIVANADDGQGRSLNIVSIPVDGSAVTPLIKDDPAPVVSPRLSPEGDRLAFVSAATGTREVYVMSLADRRRVRVSASGGFNPIWGRDGGELFFQNVRNEIMRAVVQRDVLAISAAPVVQMHPCTHEPDARFNVEPAEINYDVTGDGARFLVKCDPQDSVPSAMTVIVNWQSKLR